MSKHSCLALCFKDIEKGSVSAQVLLVLENTSAGDVKDGWRWSLPGGKCCHDKLKEVNCCPETADQTVVRECKEETGYDVAPGELLLSEDKANPETGAKFKRHVYWVEILGGKPLAKRVFSQETPKWFPITKLPRNLFFSHRQLIQRVLLSVAKPR